MSWLLRLPDPALSLLSTLLLAATNPKYTRRLSFVALLVFPGAIISFVYGFIALVRFHPEDAVGSWMWSAFLFALGSGIVAWVARSTTRGLEQGEPPDDEDLCAPVSTG